MSIEEIKRYVEANEKRDRKEMLQVEIFAYKSLKLLLSSLETKEKEMEKIYKTDRFCPFCQHQLRWGDLRMTKREEAK